MLKHYPSVLNPYTSDILCYKNDDGTLDCLYDYYKELLTLNEKIIV